jgi:hypothetical protein
MPPEIDPSAEAGAPLREHDEWTDAPDPEVEAAWAEEIRRRIQAFRSGEMKTIPIQQALEEADRLLDGKDGGPADRLPRSGSAG